MKWHVVIITAVIESLVLWLISFLLKLDFMEIAFLGGLAIFGFVWLFQLNSNRFNNEYNASVKGWNREDIGGVKPFQFRMSSTTLGLLLFTFISFVLTVIEYYPYFINS